ncbi:uncharacterized protein [Periplaneta americana]|uniref:uncharacterized protein n=1 Tax=Periplaneta americana TaxID=6978 RepID=UPI0037E97C6B
MPSCIICKLSPDSYVAKEEKLHFYRFPRGETYAKWLEFCKIAPGASLAKNLYLCARHFKSEDYIGTMVKMRSFLRPGTVPCFYPPIGPDVCRHDNDGCCMNTGTDVLSKEDQPQILQTVDQQMQIIPVPSTSCEVTSQSSLVNECVISSSNTIEREENNPLKILGVRSDKELSPSTRKLVMAFRKLKRRNRYLKQKLRTITASNRARYSSKGKKSESQVIDFSSPLLKDQLANLTRPPTGCRWSRDAIATASELYAHGATAYDLMRSVVTLPSVRQLIRTKVKNRIFPDTCVLQL